MSPAGPPLLLPAGELTGQRVDIGCHPHLFQIPDGSVTGIVTALFQNLDLSRHDRPVASDDWPHVGLAEDRTYGTYIQFLPERQKKVLRHRRGTFLISTHQASVWARETMTGMVAVWKRLRAERLEARLVLQVHDELIVECPESEAETVAKLLDEEMEGVAALAVPLTAEAHWGRNWLEAKG